MALDKTCVAATGKVSLAANTTYSARFTGGGPWLKICVLGSADVWYTVVRDATDETAVTPGNSETFCAPGDSVSWHKVGNDDFVLNMEAEAAVTVGAQRHEIS